MVDEDFQMKKKNLNKLFPFFFSKKASLHPDFLLHSSNSMFSHCFHLLRWSRKAEFSRWARDLSRHLTTTRFNSKRNPERPFSFSDQTPSKNRHFFSSSISSLPPLVVTKPTAKTTIKNRLQAIANSATQPPYHRIQTMTNSHHKPLFLFPFSWPKGLQQIAQTTNQKPLIKQQQKTRPTSSNFLFPFTISLYWRCFSLNYNSGEYNSGELLLQTSTQLLHLQRNP